MLGYFYWPAAEPLADARGTLGFRGTPVDNHWHMERRYREFAQDVVVSVLSIDKINADFLLALMRTQRAVS